MRRDLILELSEIEEAIKRHSDDLELEWTNFREASGRMEELARRLGGIIERLKLEE